MRFLSTVLLLTFALGSCAHQQQPVSVSKADSEKKENVLDENLVSANAEKALGEAMFGSLLRKQKFLEISDEFKTYTAEITKKLGENSNRPDITYEVFFLDSKEFLTGGFPGGKIVISKAFLTTIKTESQFANLIANQIAHIAKQHLIKNILRDSEYAAALKAETVTERMQQQAAFVLFDMGFDVDMINEADRLAPTYAMHVGYDINGLRSLLIAVQEMMSKTKYGNTDYNYNWMSHRTSMNGVFVKGLEKFDKSGFPKAEDRFAAMMKKIKPVKKKKS